MLHEWTLARVDGFAAGETDFAARLAASSQSVRDDFDNNVMSPLVNGPDGVVLVIIGHSDRVDTGADHRTCLQLEVQASEDRANSADNAVLAMFADWLTPAPTSWSDLPHIAAILLYHGASSLRSDGGTEEQRKLNRRVEFQVCRFTPDP